MQFVHEPLLLLLVTVKSKGLISKFLFFLLDQIKIMEDILGGIL